MVPWRLVFTECFGGRRAESPRRKTDELASLDAPVWPDNDDPSCSRRRRPSLAGLPELSPCLKNLVATTLFTGDYLSTSAVPPCLRPQSLISSRSRTSIPEEPEERPDLSPPGSSRTRVMSPLSSASHR